MRDDLARLFDERYQPMVRLAAWLVGDHGAAEDIVQDAFVRLNTSAVDLAALDSASAYLRTTVVNLTRTRLRRSALGRIHVIEQRRSAPGPESFLVDEQLVAAIAGLSRRQRECVVLRYSEDLTVDQIAAVIGTSAGSVKTHLHRGLAALANVLDESNYRELR